MLSRLAEPVTIPDLISKSNAPACFILPLLRYSQSGAFFCFFFLLSPIHLPITKQRISGFVPTALKTLTITPILKELA